MLAVFAEGSDGGEDEERIISRRRRDCLVVEAESQGRDVGTVVSEASKQAVHVDHHPANPRLRVQNMYSKLPVMATTT